jgi:hypothetical protein
MGFLGTMFAVCCLMVVLVSSGMWRTLAETFGIGEGGASSSQLTTPAPAPTREPGAKTPAQWLSELFGQMTGAAPEAPAPALTAKPDAIPSAPKVAIPAIPAPSAPANGWGGHIEAYNAALGQLNGIAVAKPSIGGYDRDAQFGGWANSPSLCGKGTTRDAILKRDLIGAASGKDCQVTLGLLHDPYTGRDIPFKRGSATSSAVQIDHVVALLDAYGSGARNWSQARRVQYANDSDVLLAVDGPANMAKGAGLDFAGTAQYRAQGTTAPDVWMPDNAAFRCDYVAKRVNIKAKYGLSMTAREKQQTTQFVAACAAGKN